VRLGLDSVGVMQPFLQAFWNSRYLLFQHPGDGGAANQIALRQLAQAVPSLTVPLDGGAIENQGFPSDVSAFELGAPHAGAHSLDNQTALQFSDGADDGGCDEETPGGNCPDPYMRCSGSRVLAGSPACAP